MEKMNLIEKFGGVFPHMVYSPIFGEGVVSRINEEEIVVTPTSNTSVLTYSFNHDGTLEENGECLLFPSYENRDWSKYTPKVTITEKQPINVYWYTVTDNKNYNAILYARLKELSGNLPNNAHPIPKKGDIWFNEINGLTCCQRENKIARMAMMIGTELKITDVDG